jgi:hypothetical protein
LTPAACGRRSLEGSDGSSRPWHRHLIGEAPPGWLDRIDAEDASAVFRLLPQEAIRGLIQEAISGVLVVSYGFGTVGP